MYPARHDIEIWAGSTFERNLTIADAADSPIDITGHSFTMSIERDDGSPVLALDNNLQGGITITSAVDGQFRIKASGSQTSDIEPQDPRGRDAFPTSEEMRYTLKYTDGAGDPWLLLYGRAVVRSA